MTNSQGSDPSKKPEDLRNLSIGITLSGGGYRASAFHLGTLTYLHKIGLLSQVRMLSTVSGGTFTGVKYILSLVHNTSFSSFFKEYYHFLQSTNLIELGLKTLSQGKIKVPSGNRNLILAMAQVYADTFLKDQNNQPYTFGTIRNAELSVQEITFNATEFRHGLAFRFQSSANPNARFGNGRVYIPIKDADQIRLADIVAASSCFPGGFEPMAFPDDFVWKNNQIPSGVRQAISKSGAHDSVALMDGGICDNQGITSLLLSNSRSLEALDLVIISDVDEPKTDLFPYPTNNQASNSFTGRITLGHLDWFIRILLTVCILTILSISYNLWQELHQDKFDFWQSFFSFVFPLFLTILTLLALWWGRSIIKEDLLPRIPQVGLASWNDLKGLTVDQLLYLVELRLKSLLTLTSSVFMRQVRRLVFRAIYNDDRYKRKVISNLIYDLMTENNLAKFEMINPPSQALQSIIDKSVKMPTTLWFDRDDQLPDLVVSGQATICFNLMTHIIRIYGKDFGQYPVPVQELWTQLFADWRNLNHNPYILLDAILSEPFIT